MCVLRAAESEPFDTDLLIDRPVIHLGEKHQELPDRDLPSRVAFIFAPDNLRQTALVFLPAASGIVAHHHQFFGT